MASRRLRWNPQPYRIPVFEILESHGLEVKLVNARQVKNVPGRKSDVPDCQWPQQLHTYGLLRGAFWPIEQICTLRAYVRQRAMLVRSAASHIQRMQKALAQMNLQLHNVVTDITGMTGMRIIKAILGGERTPDVLAAMRDRRCKNSATTIARSLQGSYRPEHLFSLRQAVELYEFHQEKITDCDRQILGQLKSFDAQNAPNDTPSSSVEEALQRMSGVDLTSIDGIDTNTALKILAEIGTDMNRWKTAKQTLCRLARPVSRHQGQWRQGIEQRHQTGCQQGRLSLSHGGLHAFQFQERFGSLSSTAKGSIGGAQSHHRHRSQVGPSGVCHDQARECLWRCPSGILRKTLSIAGHTKYETRSPGTGLRVGRNARGNNPSMKPIIKDTWS